MWEVTFQVSGQDRRQNIGVVVHASTCGIAIGKAQRHLVDTLAGRFVHRIICAEVVTGCYSV